MIRNLELEIATRKLWKKGDSQISITFIQSACIITEKGDGNAKIPFQFQFFYKIHFSHFDILNFFYLSC